MKQSLKAPFLFDGNKLAWSSAEVRQEIRVTVDLDAEEGRQPGKKPNVFNVAIRLTKKLNIAVVSAWINGQISFDDHVLEAMNFMQHMMHDGPERNPNFLRLRNKFFAKNGQRADLGGGVEVWRGVFQSLRPAHPGNLTVNLDVANTCFWRPMAFTNMLVNKWRKRDINEISLQLKDIEDPRTGQRKRSDLFPMLAKHFKRMRVTPDYKGFPFPGREFTIDSFIPLDAKEYTIEYRDPQSGQVTPQLSIYDYFRRKYNITLTAWRLPVVQMTKKGVVYPMEVLQVVSAQKYNFKLDELQTANMIKFAVSRPDVRRKAIHEGQGWLNWQNDRCLAHFGMKISPNMTRTKARLLPNPKIKFGSGMIDPGTQGRWDLRGKKFHTPNPEELVAWGIGVFAGRLKVEKNQIEQFAQSFIKQYRGHGGRIAGGPPHIMMLSADAGKGVEELYQATGNKFQRRPQLMVFMVPNRDAFHYLRIKKSADCRYGIVSQCLQIQQVQKNNPQYISNVLMKVNAKLGGCTSEAICQGNSGTKGGLKPWTMIIGADVSHPSPGSDQPSTAAFTVSLDKHGGRYAAGVQTNGVRVETITAANFKDTLVPLIRHWSQNIGQGKTPQQVYYLRDGVSEGQYQHVLQKELPHIRKSLDAVAGAENKWNGKITVVIASKRHHIRAFPADKNGADKNGNPLPGVVLETGVTSPHNWDFYLYSHIALQGTSRPVHYSVIHDDAGHPPEFLMNMIYEHCYQYMRSTTSVSLHPAVYYAHIASARAKAHENVASSEGARGGPGFKMKTKVSDSTPPPTEVEPLIELFNQTQIKFKMYYI